MPSSSFPPPLLVPTIIIITTTTTTIIIIINATTTIISAAAPSTLTSSLVVVAFELVNYLGFLVCILVACTAYCLLSRCLCRRLVLITCILHQHVSGLFGDQWFGCHGLWWWLNFDLYVLVLFFVFCFRVATVRVDVVFLVEIPMLTSIS